MSGYKLSKNAVRKTATVVSRVLGQRKPLGTTATPEGHRDTWYWGKLATDLDAGSMTAPTTCEVDVWLPIPGNTDDPVQFAVATDSNLLGLTVVNRDSSLSGVSGLACKIQYAFGEWSIFWIGCEE
jgi:hypothetical protein